MASSPSWQILVTGEKTAFYSGSLKHHHKPRAIKYYLLGIKGGGVDFPRMTTQALLSPTEKGGTGMRSFINSLSCTLFCEITLLGEQPKILIYLFHRLKSIFNEWSMAMPCQCVCRWLNLCAHTQTHTRFAKGDHGVPQIGGRLHKNTWRWRWRDIHFPPSNCLLLSQPD